MEWNPNWDWEENIVGFGSKSVESPKKLQLADYPIIDDEEINPESFNLWGGSGNSCAYGSATGYGTSSKSSISASTDSSTKNPNSQFTTFFEGSSGNFSKELEIQASAEPLIGLKLGKRTYFENQSGVGGNVKSSIIVKKAKLCGHNAPPNSIPCCQVEGCNIDLSMAKEYHKKHRVCDNHSKSSKVMVGGYARRFCQQCSRFHSLSEFDDKKRSCRRRLSDHNARRRKPQESIMFNSTRISSPFYEGRQRMSLLSNNTPLIQSRTTAISSVCNSKFTITKGYSWNPSGDGSTDVFNPGSHIDASPEYHRALSLLSSNSSLVGSCAPESDPLQQRQMQENDTIISQALMHAIPEGVPISSSEFWPNSHVATNNYFQ